MAVELTSRCNRSCAYCYNVWRGGRELSDMPAADLVELVEKTLAESGLSALQISGGEPLLHPGFLDFVEGVRKPGRAISLVTDGALIDDSLAAELKRLGVAPVQPTLLAARREVHNELKGADCFDETIAGIGALQRAGVPVSVSFVCTRRNYAHFKDMVDLCFALGLKVVAFSRFCTAGAGARRHAELAPTPEMLRHCLDIAEEANARLGMKVSIAISLPLCVLDPAGYPHVRFGRCALGSQSPGYTVGPDGTLRACSISATVLGDLQVESWTDIIARARTDYFAGMTAVPHACRSCDVVAQCGGGCRESALSCFGDPSHPDPLALGPAQ